MPLRRAQGFFSLRPERKTKLFHRDQHNLTLYLLCFDNDETGVKKANTLFELGLLATASRRQGRFAKVKDWNDRVV